MYKTEQQLFAESWKDFQKTEWLFPHPEAADLTSQDYLHFFHVRNGAMRVGRFPSPYKRSLVQTLQNKIVFTSQIIDEGRTLPYTVAQINERTHIIFDWVWDKNLKD